MSLIHVTEHRPTTVDEDRLTFEQGSALYAAYRDYVDVTFPSPATANRWQLTFRGWLGVIRVDSETEIVISPKVPVSNLGRMLQYAYDVPIATFPQLVNCTSLTELYDQLVLALTQEAFKLVRQGLYHEYLPQRRDLGVVRGRVDVRRTTCAPASVRVACITSDRTPDILHNQLVLAALNAALRSGLCSDSTQAYARQAFRQLEHGVSVVDIDAAVPARFAYSRLTERYRPAHALSALIIQNAGTAGEGAATSVPFLINMPQLYERFVARWLAMHLPAGLVLDEQKHWSVGTNNRVDFYIDLTIRDAATGRAQCVLDTKYKDQAYPAAHDVAQVGYYAMLESCGLAGLVLPVDSGASWDAAAGAVRIFRSAFDLSADLGKSGATFLAELLRRMQCEAIAQTGPVQ